MPFLKQHTPSHVSRRLAAMLLLMVLVWSGCDTVEPVEGPVLVVEGFFDVGKPLPHIQLRRTMPLSVPYGSNPATAVSDAAVQVTMNGATIPYEPLPDRPGLYRAAAADPAHVPPRASFALQVSWNGQVAQAAGSIPPPIRIDSVRVTAPDKPVDAILIDSLFLDPTRLDSLRLDSLGMGTQRGFIYPVEVVVWWTTDFMEVGADSAYWVRTHLKPVRDASAGAFDLFLRPEQVQRERTMPRGSGGERSWIGVYAVPVDTKDDPMPAHRLRVSLLRSGRDYARFATSRDAPERREPVSNVRGGIGIVAGVSVDSLTVDVP